MILTEAEAVTETAAFMSAEALLHPKSRLFPLSKDGLPSPGLVLEFTPVWA
jgi:hypothetical protein